MSNWKFLRDVPAAGDTDLVATNTAPASATPAVATTRTGAKHGYAQAHPTEAVAFYVLAINAAGAVLARGACTFTSRLVESFDEADDTPAHVTDTEVLADCVLQKPYRVPFNGGDSWTVLLTDVADAPAGTDHFRILQVEVDV